MEDDELTQEILHQFDLVCTQYQLGCESKSIDFSKTNLNHAGGNICSEPHPTALSRTTSLDGSPCITKLSDVKKNTEALNLNVENTNLKKEVDALREELYMKLGELAAVKESATRSNASKSDTITRLETSLSSERDEFQRKISELNTQLAFREADYRLVSSELARVKEILSVRKSHPTHDFTSQLSPASQLITSVSASPTVDLTNGKKCSRSPLVMDDSPNFHLPAPVTPLPSRRKHQHVNEIWHLANVQKTNISLKRPKDDEACMAPNLTSSETFTTVDPDVTELGTPSKRARCVANNSPQPTLDCISCPSSNTKPGVDIAVATDPPIFTGPGKPSRKLAFRTVINSNSPYRVELSNVFPSSCMLINPSNLATDMMRLTVSESDDPSPTNGSYATPCAISDRYLSGIRLLLDSYDAPLVNHNCAEKRSIMIASVVRSLSNSMPHFLCRIDNQLNAYLQLIRSAPNIHCSSQTAYAHTPPEESTNDLPSLCAVPECAETGLNECGVSYLGEDPFAGAPASQIVTPLIRPLVYRRCDSGVPLSSVDDGLHNDSGSANPRIPVPYSSQLSVQNKYLVKQGIQGFRQLQCLMEICILLRTISNDVTFGYSIQNQWVKLKPTEQFPNCSKASPISNTISRLASSVGQVVSTFIGELAKIYLRADWLPFDGTVSDEELHPTYHSTGPSAATTQSQLISTGRKLNAVQINNSLGLCDVLLASLALFSMLAVNLASLIAAGIGVDSCLGAYSDQSENGERTGTWPPSIFDCFVVASAASHIGRDVGNVTTECAVKWYGSLFAPFEIRDFIGLIPVITFCRLSRSLISSDQWHLGHTTEAWWNTTYQLENDMQPLENTPKLDGDNFSSRSNYLKQVVGTSATCQLSWFLNWVKKEADSFSVFNETGQFANGLSIDWDLQHLDLLNEFSRVVISLASRTDSNWSQNCSCKAEIYSTLVCLSKTPLNHLLALPTTMIPKDCDAQLLQETNRFLTSQASYVNAFGFMTSALISLLWCHGDNCFQTYTDSLPSYFYLIASLSRWVQQSKIVVHSSSSSTPQKYLSHQTVLKSELVEELHDFDSIGDNGLTADE